MAKTDSVTRYYVDVDEGAHQRRSVKAMMADRKCSICRQADTTESIMAETTKSIIKQITAQCSKTQDFLLPDTPLIEGIFRIILAGGNKPLSADEISKELLDRWSISAYPRDLSPVVVKKVLDHNESYSIIAKAPVRH